MKPRITWCRRRSTAALLVVLLAGCDSGEYPTVPRFGYLVIAVRSNGGDLDLNGYKAVVDGRERLAQFYGDGPGASLAVESGEHSVRLDDVASNCTSKGGLIRSATVAVGQIVSVDFDIECVATGLAITTSTNGSDTPDSLQILVSGRPYRMAKTDALQIGRLTPGNYTVSLVVPEHCAVSGGAPAAVAVVAGKVVAVPPFQVDCAPAMRSPRIAYVNSYSNRGTTQRWIETVKPDGSAAAQVTPGDTPAWSPDGTKLAVSTMSCAPDPWYGDEVCDLGIALFDPETGNHSILRAATDASRPSWTAAGNVIAFERRELLAGPALLMMTRTSDSSAVRIAITADGLKSSEQPAWSPDGQRLAFTCSWFASVSLCLVNRDGSGLVHLTDDALVDGDPAWSPDGKRIAFTRRGAYVSNRALPAVAVFDLATGSITLLTQGSDPTWSPDGSKLAFADSNGIFVIDADGTNRTRLTTGAHTAPAWRP